MDGFLIGCIAAAAGGIVGVAVAYLWTDRRCRGTISDLTTARALAEQRAATLEQEVAAARAAGEDKAAGALSQLERERAESSLLRQQLSESQVALSAARAQLEASERNIEQQKKLLDDANQRLTESFAAVSVQSLEQNTKAFLSMAEERFKALSVGASGDLDQRKAQIATLLKPLEETLAAYQKRLGEVETSRTAAYAELRQQIGHMHAVQQALSTQTTQLVSALTRPNVRGQWGEIALRRLVELAGMTDRCDFLEQTSVTTDDGRLRPDMIVQLPSNRRVIIDCKAVLGAFLDAAAAPDDASREVCLRRHSEHIRARAKDLSSKAYWSQFEQTPEFVVLFLPGESFLYAAAERDVSLIEDCLRDRVVLATPTTLIALLKSIEFGWRQEALSRNADEIRKLGTEIYDRLAILASHMDKLGTGIDGVVSHYNNAVKSLETRLLVSARKMGEMGAKNEKEIPAVELVDKRPQELGSVLKPDKSPLLGE